MYELTDASVEAVALALAGVPDWSGTSPSDADAWRRDARYALTSLEQRRRILGMNGVAR